MSEVPPAVSRLAGVHVVLALVLIGDQLRQGLEIPRAHIPGKPEVGST
jgi:hypothetical protein